jgi:hypothetical protein
MTTNKSLKERKKYKSEKERSYIAIRTKAKIKIDKKAKKAKMSKIDYYDKLAEVELSTV